MDTQTLIAQLCAPIITGCVAAAGVVITQRRQKKDLESRRKNLVDFAQQRLSAAQIWHSMASRADGGGNIGAVGEKVNSIVSSAVDSIIQAQQLNEISSPGHRSILADVFLARKFETIGGKIFRALYFVGLVCISIILAAIIPDAFGRREYSQLGYGILGIFILYVGPIFLLRWTAVAFENRRKRMPSTPKYNEVQPRSARMQGQPVPPPQTWYPSVPQGQYPAFPYGGQLPHPPASTETPLQPSIHSSPGQPGMPA